MDIIARLSPATSIDQKSASRKPRSAIGTVTETHDYLRLRPGRGAPLPAGVDLSAVQHDGPHATAAPTDERLAPVRLGGVVSKKMRRLVDKLSCLVALAVVVSAGGLAACGGQSSGTDELEPAFLQVRDPRDPEISLTALVGVEALSAEDLDRELSEDPLFAALVDDAINRGFGEVSAAMNLVYDNGLTVTAAPLGSCTADVVHFAYRLSAPTPRYLLVELDHADDRLAIYDQDGTVSVDLATGESSAVESPTAHHSCSFLHCFDTALDTAYNAPGYGWLVERVCKSCADVLVKAYLLVIPIGKALAAVSCITCFATLSAVLIASIWVCWDDPCELCRSDSCGEVASGGPPEVRCGIGVFPPDPETGSTAGRYWIDEEYVCEGISWRYSPSLGGITVPDYHGTQCVLHTDATGLVQPCPYGCAPPVQGEFVSRYCQPPPSYCDPQQCTGETHIGGDTCSLQPNGTYAVTHPVEVAGCVDVANGQECGVVATRTEVVMVCPGGCAADGRSCAQCPADQPQGDRVCRQVTGNNQTTPVYEVVQEWVHYAWNEVRQECLQTTYTKVVGFCGTAGCSGGVCGTATQCDPATCNGTEVLSSVCNAVGRGATVTRVIRTYHCNVTQTECVWVDAESSYSCARGGCSADGTSCG